MLTNTTSIDRVSSSYLTLFHRLYFVSSENFACLFNSSIFITKGIFYRWTRKNFTVSIGTNRLLCSICKSVFSNEHGKRSDRCITTSEIHFNIEFRLDWWEKHISYRYSIISYHFEDSFQRLFMYRVLWPFHLKPKILNNKSWKKYSRTDMTEMKTSF